MKKLLILSFLFLSISINSFASDSNSLANREKLKFTFNHGVAVLYKRGVFTSQIGYIVNSQVTLDLTYMNLETSTSRYDKSDDETNTYDSGDGGALELGIKYFDDNSLYYRLGLYYRKQTTRRQKVGDGVIVTFRPNEVGEGTIVDAGLILGIGNQWQWRHLTFGVEWAGFSSTLVNWQFENTGDGESVSLIEGRLLNVFFGASF